jgi:aryl-alcohol dehydrogenase
MVALAAICREYGKPLAVEEIELEEPRADEILVRMVATGVCHTDITMIDTPQRVPLPIVLGHEGAGVVERVGNMVTEFQPGDTVVLSYGHCGRCPSCLSGVPYHCEMSHKINFSGSRLDGTSPLSRKGESIHGMFFAQSSFATFAIALARAAVRVPGDLPLEVVAPFGCGVQTGAGAVLNVFKAPIGSSIAVFGSGSVGMSAVMAAKAAGCKTIITVFRNKRRTQLATDVGATHYIDPKTGSVPEKIKDLTGGGADFTLDTTGNREVIQTAFASLNRTGQCAIVAGFGVDLTLSAWEILCGKIIRGVLLGESVPRRFIPELIELYRQDRFPVHRIMKSYQFSNINDAINDSKAGKVVKPVLLF